LQFRQIASVLGKLSLFVIIVAHLGGCGTAYAPKAAVKTGTVRTSTLKQMDSLKMDRSAPVLIRIYKEESTLEVWKQNRSGSFALLSFISDLQVFRKPWTKAYARGSSSAGGVL
jgi:murein L,D-transpeptidase YafK